MHIYIYIERGVVRERERDSERARERETDRQTDNLYIIYIWKFLKNDTLFCRGKLVAY